MLKNEQAYKITVSPSLTPRIGTYRDLAGLLTHAHTYSISLPIQLAYLTYFVSWVIAFHAFTVAGAVLAFH